MKNISKNIFLVIPEISFFLSHRISLIRGLINRGWNFTVITSSDENPIPIDGIEYLIIDTHRKRFSLLNVLKNSFFLMRLIHIKKPLLIYSVSHRSIFLARIANFFKNTKSIYAISGMGSAFSGDSRVSKIFNKEQIIKILILLIYRYIIKSKHSNFLLQNEADKNFLTSSKISKPSNCFLISGNGIDEEFFSDKPVNNDLCHFIMISRLLRDKGVIEFLKAASIVSKTHKNCKFTLYGDIDNANFKSLNYANIKPFLSNKIHYAGYKKDIKECIKNGSILVLPSYREGFSKVLMEAQSCSRAVITSNVRGCKDVIIEDITGKLVPPKDVQALSDAMEFFIQDKKKIQIMGSNAFKHARKNFTVEIAVQKHLEMFNKILSS